MDKANQKDVPYYLKSIFDKFVMPKEVNLKHAKTVEHLIGSRSSSLLFSVADLKWVWKSWDAVLNPRRSKTGIQVTASLDFYCFKRGMKNRFIGF